MDLKYSVFGDTRIHCYTPLEGLRKESVQTKPPYCVFVLSSLVNLKQICMFIYIRCIKPHQVIFSCMYQYHKTVFSMAGDMLRYLQDSRERATEMIRVEVQRERQDTARKMRRYYLTCLQELLEDGGKTTGQEAIIV